MAARHTVEVTAFGRFGSFALTVPFPGHARALKDAIATRLGLKSSSLVVFSLFEGPPGYPTRVLQDDDPVPQGAQNLSLQRWCFDVQQEAKVVRYDDIAIHLLFSEAVFRLDQGTLHPSESEREELVSLSDPHFPTERQFLELARTVNKYSALTVPGCKLVGELVTNDVTIASGSTLTCVTDLHGLLLQEEGGDVQLEWPWEQIKRWRSPTHQMIKFDVCLKQKNAPIMQWMTLETVQSYTLLCAASKICDFLERKGTAACALNPLPNPRLAGRPINPLAEFVNSELFSEVKFSSLGPKRS